MKFLVQAFDASRGFVLGVKVLGRFSKAWEFNPITAET
jgi:hypothetical protein